jgi:hypothetical protein
LLNVTPVETIAFDAVIVPVLMFDAVIVPALVPPVRVALERTGETDKTLLPLPVEGVILDASMVTEVCDDVTEKLDRVPPIRVALERTGETDKTLLPLPVEGVILDASMVTEVCDDVTEKLERVPPTSVAFERTAYVVVPASTAFDSVAAERYGDPLSTTAPVPVDSVVPVPPRATASVPVVTLEASIATMPDPSTIFVPMTDNPVLSRSMAVGCVGPVPKRMIAFDDPVEMHTSP